MAAEAQPPAEQDASGPAAEPTRAATGIAGLDVVLGGGRCAAICMSLKGRRAREKRRSRCTSCWPAAPPRTRLWITTAETRDELLVAAHSHGWSLEGIEVLALSMAEHIARPEQRQTLFRPSHVELDETMQAVLAALERVQPARVVLDSVSMLRDMADEPFAYRRHMLSLKNALRRPRMHRADHRRVAGAAGPALAHAGPWCGATAAGGDPVWQRAASGGNRQDAGDDFSQRPA